MKNAYAAVRGERGSSLIAALFIVMTLGVAGMGMTQLAMSEDRSSALDIQKNQVFQIGTAGLEYAKSHINNGLDPTVNHKDFAGGDFSISTDTNTNQITVASRLGDSRGTQTISTTFGDDCIRINTDNVTRFNNELRSLQIEKICNRTITIASITMEWNTHNCARTGTGDVETLFDQCKAQNQVRDNSLFVTFLPIENTKLYYPYVGIGSPANGLARSGTQMDTIDYSMTNNSSYLAHYYYVPDSYDYSILFGGNNLVASSLYKMTLHFADGSTKAKVFRVL